MTSPVPLLILLVVVIFLIVFAVVFPRGTATVFLVGLLCLRCCCALYEEYKDECDGDEQTCGVCQSVTMADDGDEG